ncbi:MAG: hypothetical protein ACOCZA_02055 [Spirochaetota bacterium]
MGEWFTGERYGRNIIGDMRNWVEGWLDWNIVLDENGGPNGTGGSLSAGRQMQPRRAVRYRRTV